MPAERILLIDDDPVDLRVLAGTLGSGGRGHELVTAGSSEDAVALVRREQPDLILLDVTSAEGPAPDAYEVCRLLKGSPDTRDAPVILLSSIDDPSCKVKGLQLGAVDYITKPFSAEEVIARVETHLKLRRLERDLACRNRELQQANARMRRDLEAAARAQRAQLPTNLPQSTAVRFAFEVRPCAELAGDALNVVEIDDHTFCIYLLDVSGHGVQSALFSVAVVRTLSPHDDRSSLLIEPDGQGGRRAVAPAEVARRLNLIYPMSAQSGHYFTLIYGVLDTQKRRFEFVSPGQPGPVLLRRAEAPRSIDAPAVPIGMLEESEYENTVLELEPGDRIFLHSDGVNEERNEEGEELGRDRLRTLMARDREIPLDEHMKRLGDEVRAWRGPAVCRDDVSLLAFELVV